MTNLRFLIINRVAYFLENVHSAVLYHELRFLMAIGKKNSGVEFLKDHTPADFIK